MDVAQVFRELWLRRLWVLPGVFVAIIVVLFVGWHVSLSPPGLRSKDLTLHSADTVVLVDSPTSVVADVGAPLRQLSVLANVYARYMTNFPVRQAIARRAGIPVDKIATQAPLASNQPAELRQPAANQRGEGLLDERKGYRLEFRTDGGLPTVTIFAGAPSTKEAVKLANAAALGFKDYIRRVEAARKTPPERRVTIRQLGPAEGGTVGRSVKRSAIVFAAVGTLLAWIVLVLLGSNIARNWHRVDDVEP